MTLPSQLAVVKGPAKGPKCCLISKNKYARFGSEKKNSFISNVEQSPKSKNLTFLVRINCLATSNFIICDKVDKGLCSALSTFRLTKFNPNSLVAT